MNIYHRTWFRDRDICYIEYNGDYYFFLMEVRKDENTFLFIVKLFEDLINSDGDYNYCLYILKEQIRSIDNLTEIEVNEQLRRYYDGESGSVDLEYLQECVNNKDLPNKSRRKLTCEIVFAEYFQEFVRLTNIEKFKNAL